ncbi:MAG: hypothetical protein ACPL1B_09125, partial [Thermoprotei archaeon]
PARDERVSELITWYVNALQKTIDLIWNNIEWRYSFPKPVRRKCGFVVKIQVGQIFECPRCDLKMDRQRVASINIRRRYLEKRRRGKKPRMRGFPHSYEPESSMRVELWVGVTLSGRSPVIWIPMKGDPEGDDVKGEGLISNYIKPNENRTPTKILMIIL